MIHKYDPDMEDDENILKIATSLEQKIIELASPLKTTFSRTSIFNPFSILHAFSHAVVGNTILRDNLHIIFTNFIEDYDLKDTIKFISVYTDDFVEISGYFDEKIHQKTMRDIAHQLFAVFDDKNFKLNSADLTLSSGDFGVKVMKYSSETKDYFYVLGYIKDRMNHELENVQFKQELAKLQLQINKLMLFF
jgi:hypothetical protein